MGRWLKIGNIHDSADGPSAPLALPGPAPRAGRSGRGRGPLKGLRLGERINTLASKALDRGQAQVDARITDLLPDPGSLEGELSPQETEAVLSGLEAVAGTLRHLRTPDAVRAQHALAGIYRAVLPPVQEAWNDEEDEDAGGGMLGGHGAVDVIGLDGAGGISGSYNKGEWR